MKYYSIIPEKTSEGYLLKVDFGEPTTNDNIVRETHQAVSELKLMGKLLLINGRASLPVGFVLAHAYNHVFGAIGIFDPKLEKYVVVVSHDPNYQIGALI